MSTGISVTLHICIAAFFVLHVQVPEMIFGWMCCVVTLALFVFQSSWEIIIGWRYVQRTAIWQQYQLLCSFIIRFLNFVMIFVKIIFFYT